MFSQKDLIRIIREELEADSKTLPSGEADAAKGPTSIEDVEAIEGVWSGGDNLALDIDQPEASGSEPTTKEPETTKIVESINKVVRDLEVAQRKSIPPQPFTLLELYNLQDKLKKELK